MPETPKTFEEWLVAQGIGSDARLDVTDAKSAFEDGRAAGRKEGIEMAAAKIDSADPSLAEYIRSLLTEGE